MEQTTTTDVQPEAAPQGLPFHPTKWARDNLFSSVGNSILTVVVALFLLGMAWGIMQFVFAPERQWNSIVSNIRLYATFAYPEGDYWRVWLSLGIVVSLTGLSLATWLDAPHTPATKIMKAAAIAGAVIIFLAAMAPASFGIRLTMFAVGLGALALSFIAWRIVGSDTLVSVMGALATAIAIGLLILWFGPLFIGPMEIARTTTVPLTVEFVIGVVSYLAGRGLAARYTPRRLQPLLVGLWLLSLPMIYLVILRAPTYDVATILSEDLPIWLVFAVGGSFLLWIVTDPKRSPLAITIEIVLVLAAIVVWLPWLSSVPLLPTIKMKAMLLVLAVFAVTAPSFSGGKESRRNVIIGWVVVVSLLQFFLITAEAPSALVIQTNFIGGLMLTLLLSAVGILLAFPLGVLLALGRTSTMPIFRVVCTVYIEVIRGVPLITILFFGALFLPLFVPRDIRIDEVVRALIAISLFSAAYLAENVRGGLQSIPPGQYEAARALGLSTVQMTLFITLPEALQAVIPALVGQTIAIFKDTSLVFIIGLTEILAIAQRVVPGQPDFVGSQRENLLFVAFVYWMFTFTFSRASQRLEKKLGVGER
jgi:general L-amino acid transport system permease protein